MERKKHPPIYKLRIRTSRDPDLRSENIAANRHRTPVSIDNVWEQNLLIRLNSECKKTWNYGFSEMLKHCRQCGITQNRRKNTKKNRKSRNLVFRIDFGGRYPAWCVKNKENQKHSSRLISVTKLWKIHVFLSTNRVLCLAFW